MSAALDDYELHLCKRGRKPTTIATPRYRLERYFGDALDRPIERWTPRLAQSLAESLADAWAPTTTLNAVNQLRTFGRICVKRRWLARNPALAIELAAAPRGERSDRHGARATLHPRNVGAGPRRIDAHGRGTRSATPPRRFTARHYTDRETVDAAARRRSIATFAPPAHAPASAAPSVWDQPDPGFGPSPKSEIAQAQNPSDFKCEGGDSNPHRSPH